jgi:hypothetical protein
MFIGRARAEMMLPAGRVCDGLEGIAKRSSALSCVARSRLARLLGTHFVAIGHV